MELFGLLLAAWAASVASVCYALLAIAVFKRCPGVARAVVIASVVVLASVGVELALLGIFGAKGAYSAFGRSFVALHFVALLLGPPAVANVTLQCMSRQAEPTWLRLFATTVSCWFACVGVLVGHIAVDEAIMGVDAERPFFMVVPRTPNHPAAGNAGIAGRLTIGRHWPDVPEPGLFDSTCSCMGTGGKYGDTMSTAVAQILREVEHLSDRERVELRRALVEQIPLSDDLTEEDFAALAASSFRALDEEEARCA